MTEKSVLRLVCDTCGVPWVDGHDCTGNPSASICLHQENERLRGEDDKQTKLILRYEQQLAEARDEVAGLLAHMDADAFSIRVLTQERDMAIAVLSWYADPKHHLPVCDHDAVTGLPLPVAVSIVQQDGGARARRALGEKE